jgi:hypothetical protein
VVLAPVDEIEQVVEDGGLLDARRDLEEGLEGRMPGHHAGQRAQRDQALDLVLEDLLGVEHLHGQVAHALVRHLGRRVRVQQRRRAAIGAVQRQGPADRRPAGAALAEQDRDLGHEPATMRALLGLTEIPASRTGPVEAGQPRRDGPRSPSMEEEPAEGLAGLASSHGRRCRRSPVAPSRRGEAGKRRPAVSATSDC